MTAIFDSSAWIEYFAGSKKGKIVKEFLDKNENIFTPAICLMEIKNKYIREGYEFKDRIDFICNVSTINDINKNNHNSYTIHVEYEVLGVMGWVNWITADSSIFQSSRWERYSSVDFIINRHPGGWRISGPTIPPHVSPEAELQSLEELQSDESVQSGEDARLFTIALKAMEKIVTDRIKNTIPPRE